MVNELQWEGNDSQGLIFSREQQSSMFELIITELVANLVLGCDHPTAYSVADINWYNLEIIIDQSRHCFFFLKFLITMRALILYIKRVFSHTFLCDIRRDCLATAPTKSSAIEQSHSAGLTVITWPAALESAKLCPTWSQACAFGTMANNVRPCLKQIWASSA